ncbi:hypothetical protein OAN91_00470 [Pelagibacteraceae bacterium]|jgi:hypothetical protein|nr:hypothetical protein [Pelagibacteraceae bacterium]
MWTIIKFDKKKLSLLKKDFSEKLGKDFIIYNPKVFLQKYKNNKLINKEFDVLGDYLLCFHKNFKDKNTLNNLKFCRGLKYFLEGFIQSQTDIEKFVNKCKSSENKDGYLSQNFYQLKINGQYKFSSGPFVEKIFKIINLHKNKIDIFMGNIKTTIKKQDYLFSAV